jgi:hypothetical protein
MALFSFGVAVIDGALSAAAGKYVAALEGRQQEWCGICRNRIGKAKAHFFESVLWLVGSRLDGQSVDL